LSRDHRSFRAGTPAPDRLDAIVRAGAARVLDRAWNESAGYCRPNRRSYPHLWLWDSCFHAIAWFALGDARGSRELDAVFVGQLPDGFLPHMRYGRRTYPRGPLTGVSSFTQPPVYARALKAGADAGFPPSDHLLDCAQRALAALWRDRLRDGLLVIVHPWEAGTDDSPRWDSWIGTSVWNRRVWTAFDRALLKRTVFSPSGQAIDNPDFVVAPASFNAIAADAATTLGELIGDADWIARGRALAAALDEAAWDRSEGLWSDVAFRGGGASVRVPTMDAALPAMCTPDPAKAAAALRQLTDPGRFGAPYGPRFVPSWNHAYNPVQYWRGPAWPQLNYLAAHSARECGDDLLAAEIGQLTKRACLRARFAEYWNPETGRGLGAHPQTWAAVAAAM
jgi:hypothetical protein